MAWFGKAGKLQNGAPKAPFLFLGGRILRVLYDCSRYLTSFNLFEWLVQVDALGAKTIVFDIRNIRGDKWPREIALKRFWSICEPGPALIGLPHEIISSGDAPADAIDIAKPGGGPLVAFCKAGKKFKRLRTVRPPRSDVEYTITLRRTQRSVGRNSDEAVWVPFAKEIGALLIKDFEDEPMHLHDRMALYAGARLNIFCSNGPGILCSLSTFPCAMFNTHHARESLLADGMKEGEQYPWMLPNQRAVWEQATPTALREHFYYWRERGTWLERKSPAPA